MATLKRKVRRAVKGLGGEIESGSASTTAGGPIDNGGGFPQTSPRDIPADSLPSTESQTEAQVADSSAVLVEDNGLSPEERAKRNEKAKQWRARKKAEAAGNPSQADSTSVAVILTLCDGLVMTGLGPDCGMTPAERGMIEPPLLRMIARADPQVKEQIEKYGDPLLLMFGLGAWGSRIFRLQREKKEAEELRAKEGGYSWEPESKPSADSVPAGVGSNGSGDTGDIGDSSIPLDLEKRVSLS